MSEKCEASNADSARSSGSHGDPPCIVGMACRLPGGISSPSGLWEFLLNHGCAQGPVPLQRFNKDGFYHPEGGSNARAGLMNVAGGYFLEEDVRTFDNAFFGIHNLEAASMDPQQRKLLEIVFECLEHTGTSMDKVSGTATGVFVGNFTLDHQTMQSRDIDAIHRFSATGCGTTILANRISHAFNFQGPSFTLDTACSSSLYALHSAVTALEAGDCDAAIVAAVNLIMSPEQCIAAGKSGVLSPTSTCHTFDVTADGYGRAEGMNAIYIKPLSKAMADGDKVWAIIRGTAVNANGKTPGITQPSAELQEAVIRKAYNKAGLDLGDSDYVECHGTGTPVGDPIEVDALGRCFKSSTRNGPLLIGSSKPGLGHSEAASGLTALIKVAMALEYAKIPPTYGVKNVNPKLNLSSLNMQIATEVEDWPRTLRRASVNAFGYGGANAHAILESASSYHAIEEENSFEKASDELLVLPISAGSTSSLSQRVSQVGQAVETAALDKLQALVHTLCERRTHLSCRSVLLAKAGSPIESPRLLDLEGELNEVSNVGTALPIAFVFTGQGAQYATMGKTLFLQNESFRTSILNLDKSLQSLLPPGHCPSWTLQGAILDEPQDSQIQEASRSQPVCTAIQIALVDLLRSWKLSPQAVVGHSSGEIAAAYCAGLLSGPQAVVVAYYRGFAVERLKQKGAMLAAGIHFDTATDLIREHNLCDQVSVACINSPESVTLSGTTNGIEELATDLQQQGKFCRKLRTGGRAYHSFMMSEVGELYKTLIRPFLGHETNNDLSTSQMHSSVITSQDGEPLRMQKNSVSATYWRDNLEKPVQFSAALGQILRTLKKVYLIEIGPNPALKSPIHQICAHLNRNHASVPYSYTLSRDKDDDFCMKRLAGLLYLANQPISLAHVNGLSSSQTTCELPPYPWDYSAGLAWQEPRASIELRNRRYPRHELLGSQQVDGNGISWTWRNVLSLEETPWIRDHKLESQIVFPASCYLAMAIEAISQALSSPTTATEPAFEFRHVNINTALIIHDDTSMSDVEIYTILSPQELSRATVSQDWHEFTISSYVSSQATVHCSGSIRIVDDQQCMSFVNSIKVPATDFEIWPDMAVWYDKFAKDGLRFGPNFQSVARLQTDSNRVRFEAISTTQLRPGVQEGHERSRYFFHPITIDACIQVAIMGSAAGDVSETNVYLPVFIDECRIRTAPENDIQAFGVIQALSTKTSPSSQRVASTLWSADHIATPLIHVQGLRMTQYKSSITQESPFTRQPCLQVRWKPDIRHVNTASAVPLDRYVTEFISKCCDENMEIADDKYLAAIGAVIDLAGHANPRMRVLELGDDCRCKEKKLVSLLDDSTGFRRYESWQSVSVDGSGALHLRDSHNGSEDDLKERADLLFIPSLRDLCGSADMIHSLLAATGLAVTRQTDLAADVLRKACFNVTELPNNKIILASRPPLLERPVTSGSDVIIVVHNPSPAVTAFAMAMISTFEHQIRSPKVQLITLDEVDHVELHSQTECISMLELEYEFLASMHEEGMNNLRKITETVNTLIWLSGADMLGDRTNPDLTLSNGLSRALMLEQPALNFTVIDVGPSDTWSALTCQNAVAILARFRHKDCKEEDKEFIQKDGLMYISRFGPDFEINSLFRRRLIKSDAITPGKLSTAHPARLAIGSSGSSDTLHFEHIREPASSTPTGHIDVLVKAVSLNAKDIYAIKGRVETREATTALEFAGVVTAVGPGVNHLRAGDDVVVGMPCHFATQQRVPVWAAHKMLPGEQYGVMATFPTIYGTALYALKDRASLRKGESILIHGGAGAFGFAAITIAKQILGSTANIYSTAGSEAKRAFITSHLGLPAANIFHSRDDSFAKNVKTATSGRGVNVVVNFLTGDLLRAGWECVAPFGRFVEIGKRDLLDAGKLDMRGFLRNATFTAFDFSDLYYEQMQYNDETFSNLLTEVFALYRSGQIGPPPITTFDGSDIVQAYRHFSAKDRLGKVVISFDQEDSRIPLSPSRYLTLFDPQKVYLLAGCLGGLGRSLSRWMVARGARNFVFLGRSGCDKSSARDLVARLERSGACVKVVRGDVCERADVDLAVAECVGAGRKLGGVVQAAMGLHEALFSRMAGKEWQQVIKPKWKGTWNLHEAIDGFDADLDFFLLTSSLSGSVGTATESNYCAANGFLDAFAHWRRKQNKPAVSVGLGMISEVGYLHEHPDIEALLLRKGIQPLTETEFLQVIDLALAGVERSHGTCVGKDLTPAHILTGLETLGFRRLAELGFDVSFSSSQDPRLAILAAALAAEQSAEEDQSTLTAEQGSWLAAAAAWTKGLPAYALAVLASEGGAASLQAAMLSLIRKRFSSLILTPVDQLDDFKPLARFGVDSMIASEFRSWFWNALKVDIPFLDILSPEKSLNVLAEFATERLSEVQVS